MNEEKVPFKRAQVKLAVTALLAHINKENETKKKSELFEKQQGLWLSIGFRKIPALQVKPCPIPLPHPLHVSSEVCFISSQPGKVMRKIFEEKGITNIQKVISLTKLRKEHKSYSLKRQLISSYDVFLCEEKIFHLVSKALGKHCYKMKKEPIPVRMRNVDLKKEVDKCLSSTLLRIGQGPSSSVLVGNVGEHKEKEMIENLLHAMRLVGAKVPGKWKNVKSMYIKTSTSVALPLYQASPVVVNDLADVKTEEDLEKKRKRKRKAIPTLKNTNPNDLATNADENDVADLAEKEIAQPVEEVTETVEDIATTEVQQQNEDIEDKTAVVSTKKKKRKVDDKKVNKLESNGIEKATVKKKKIPAKKTGPKKMKVKATS